MNLKGSPTHLHHSVTPRILGPESGTEDKDQIYLTYFITLSLFPRTGLGARCGLEFSNIWRGSVLLSKVEIRDASWEGRSKVKNAEPWAPPHTQWMLLLPWCC